jgi:hypothetical protein
LIDIDTVFLRELPSWSGDAFAYDHSAAVFSAEGRDRIASDLERVAGRSIASPTWYGGEFTAGTTSFFAKLAPILEYCWPRYLNNLNNIHGIGDEMVVSAALNLARLEGATIDDAGERRAVARYWSSRTRNKMEPFSTVSDVCLLHLPADKRFLASQAYEERTASEFLSHFRRHARLRIMRERIANAVDYLRGRKLQHIPELV